MNTAKKYQSLNISGMTCTNCAKGIEKHLTKKGIKEVKIDFANAEAHFLSKNIEMCIFNSCIFNSYILGSYIFGSYVFGSPPRGRPAPAPGASVLLRLRGRGRGARPQARGPAATVGVFHEERRVGVFPEHTGVL